MRLLTTVMIDSKKDLKRYVIETSCGAKCVDEELDYQGVKRRKFDGVTVNKDYTISASGEALTAIILAVELVMFIDSELSK